MPFGVGYPLGLTATPAPAQAGLMNMANEVAIQAALQQMAQGGASRGPGGLSLTPEARPFFMGNMAQGADPKQLIAAMGGLQEAPQRALPPEVDAAIQGAIAPPQAAPQQQPQHAAPQQQATPLPPTFQESMAAQLKLAPGYMSPKFAQSISTLSVEEFQAAAEHAHNLGLFENKAVREAFERRARALDRRGGG
jgi:hypothetical protein